MASSPADDGMNITGNPKEIDVSETENKEKSDFENA
jgi:hypothetical protein